MIDLGALFGWLAGPVNMFGDGGGWMLAAGAVIGGYTLWSMRQDRDMRPPKRKGPSGL